MDETEVSVKLNTLELELKGVEERLALQVGALQKTVSKVADGIVELVARVNENAAKFNERFWGHEVRLKAVESRDCERCPRLAEFMNLKQRVHKIEKAEEAETAAIVARARREDWKRGAATWATLAGGKGIWWAIGAAAVLIGILKALGVW